MGEEETSILDSSVSFLNPHLHREERISMVQALQLQKHEISADHLYIYLEDISKHSLHRIPTLHSVKSLSNLVQQLHNITEYLLSRQQSRHIETNLVYVPR